MANDDNSEKRPGTEFGRTMAGSAGQAVHGTGDAVQEAARDVGRAVKNAGETVVVQGEAMVEWVKARPMTSLAIGAVIGTVIGYCLGRRMS